MGDLADLFDPKLKLARDLNEVIEGTETAKPRKAKRLTKDLRLPTHIFIPDTQVKPGVPTMHLDWIGSYIADTFADREQVKVIIAGDWWDMPSLSSYDRGTARMEGRRFVADVDAGNQAFSRFDSLIPKKKSWEYHFLFGNHEERILRAANTNPQLEGLLGYYLLDTKDWQRHDYLEVVDIDGVWYSHAFVNRGTGRPIGGATAEYKLGKIGHSFTMGHQQQLTYGIRFVGDKSQHGLVAGACYLHNEEYLTPQGNAHWRGICVMNAVQGGSYSFMDVTLDFLCRRFEGKTLADFMETYC